MELVEGILTTQNIAGIIALTAVISSVISVAISGIISLISQLMSQRHEWRMNYWKTYYKKCSNTFTSMLESAGKLLGNSSSDAEILNLMSLLYQSYAYADSQLSETLDAFYSKLEKWNNNIDSEELLTECQNYVIVVAHDVNRVLIKYKNNRCIHTRWYTKKTR